MHLLLIFGIALVVFGPKKLPELGKGLGEAIRGFKKSIHEVTHEAKPNQIESASAKNEPKVS